MDPRDLYREVTIPFTHGTVKLDFTVNGSGIHTVEFSRVVDRALQDVLRAGMSIIDAANQKISREGQLEAGMTHFIGTVYLHNFGDFFARIEVDIRLNVLLPFDELERAIQFTVDARARGITETLKNGNSDHLARTFGPGSPGGTDFTPKVN